MTDRIDYLPKFQTPRHTQLSLCIKFQFTAIKDTRFTVDFQVIFKNCYYRSEQYIFPHYFFLETNNFQIQKFIYKSKTMLNISRYAYLCIQTQNLEVSGQNLDVLGY